MGAEASASLSFFFAAMFYVYILFSKSIDRYYIGHTSDVLRRLDEHNNPVESSKYTAKGIPWSLVLSFEISPSKGEAIKVERFFKRQKSRSFIQRLITQNGNDEFFTNLKKTILK